MKCKSVNASETVEINAEIVYFYNLSLVKCYNPLFHRVFGAKPLEDVIKNIRQLVLQDLEIALARQAPNSTHDDSDLFELPPLVIEGIPTPIDKMSQQQLRMFIPHMLKYSTGRGKPG